MNRRRAAAVAGAVTATAVAAALAIGVNFGLFGLTSSADRVGTLRPVDMPGATVGTDPIVATEPVPADPATADPATADPAATDAGAVVIVPDRSHDDDAEGARTTSRDSNESHEHEDADD